MKFTPGLYIISTPIGNIQDISFRALETLKNSDFIYCEDTRITNKLLEKYSIFGKKLRIYNDHSTNYERELIEKFIIEEKIISIVSDAGTPLISDPGFKLVSYLYSKNINVDVIPGPCALISGLVLSSLPTNSFYFGGFLEKTSYAKIKQFSKLVDLESTLIFYETANRISDSINCALSVFGNRKSCIVREITKLYQTKYLMNLEELLSTIKENKIKGEIVFLIEGKNKKNIFVSEEEIYEEFLNLIKENISIKSASEIILEKYKGSITKNKLYKLSNSLKN